MAWDGSTAATARSSMLESVVWSPCDRFIAITCYGARTVDVLDSATLQRLQTLESPQDVSIDWRLLAFSPDSRLLTCCSGPCSCSLDEELFAVNWDLQTGGVANVIRLRPKFECSTMRSIAYSTDGKMAGVLYYDYLRLRHSGIFVIDVTSHMLVHSHSLNDTRPLSKRIWTHGESLRFATADATTITIWEVGFTSSATPTKVKTLPAPVDFDGKHPEDTQLHPAPFRLAFVSRERILIWDAQNSRYLLECADVKFYPRMTFSSDGRFFACSTGESSVYLWKESLAGYVLHGILASSSKYPIPLLTQSGESVMSSGVADCVVQLWRTKSFTTPPLSISARPFQRAEAFTLEFSPDGLLAVVARQEDNAVTVLNLKSGFSQLTVDARMKVYGLGFIGNAVVAIGNPKVVAWNLLAEDHVPGAWVGLEDISWTINLNDRYNRISTVVGASISPDSRHIVLKCTSPGTSELQIFNTSTGEWLGNFTSVTELGEIHFAPNGCDIWCAAKGGEASVLRVCGGEKVLEYLKLKVGIEDPPEGYPWGSSRGYRVTDDWWIIGPDGKRLLMLPPPWQSYAVQRVWKGQFLALLHRGLSEAVILELEINRDL